MADLDKALESLNGKVAQKKKDGAASTTMIENESASLIPKAKKGRIPAPNALFRSALFPALNNNQPRKKINKESLFSVGGLDVILDGEQFDQTDLDVYLAILHIAKDFDIGKSFTFTAYQLLKLLKIDDSGGRYQWLQEVIYRLTKNLIWIKDHRKKYVGSLIDSFVTDDLTDHYKVSLNIDYAILFHKGLWSGINFEQRQAIGRNKTAKSLHAYYSTHTNPAPHKIETLAKIAGLENKNKYMIPATIIKAHQVLCSEKVDFLENYDVEDKKIKVTIKDSK